MIYSKTKTQAGIALLEALIYIVIIGFFFSVIITNLIVITRSHRGLAANRDLEQSAVVVMDRLTRDIRAAADVDELNSVLGSSPGSLTLQIRNEAETYDQINFSLNGSSTLVVSTNSVEEGALTLPTVTVTNLTFDQISVASSSAVRITLGLEAGEGEFQKSETFYNTIILRETYFGY